MDNRGIGLLIAGFGAVVVVVGLVVASGGMSWFGRLPGDIRYETEHTRVFVPITSMIVVSVVLTVVLTLLSRWR